MNMPGRSSPAGLGSSARTAMERVTGSTRESRVVTLPLNTRPGKPSVTAVTGRPTSSSPRKACGTLNSSLITDESSRVVITAPGLTSPPRLTFRKPVRPSKGARITVSSRRARAAATRASPVLTEVSSWSSWARERAWTVETSRPRANWLRLSARLASASASSAATWVRSNSTSTVPRRTCWPSVKRMALMVLDTLEVMATDSRARAVPTASISAPKDCFTGFAVTTRVGCGPPRPRGRSPASGELLALRSVQDALASTARSAAQARVSLGLRFIRDDPEKKTP